MCEPYCNALPWITGRCKGNVCIGSGFEPESQKMSVCNSHSNGPLLEDVHSRMTVSCWLVDPRSNLVIWLHWERALTLLDVFKQPALHRLGYPVRIMDTQPSASSTKGQRSQNLQSHEQIQHCYACLLWPQTRRKHPWDIIALILHRRAIFTRHRQVPDNWPAC